MSAIAPAQTLLLEGPDAVAFAQAQFAGNLATLAVNQWQFNAWLGANGRVRALFQLARLDEQSLLLLLRGGDAANLREGLQRYVLRARVALRPSPWTTLDTQPATPAHVVQQHADDITLGCTTHALHLHRARDGDITWQALQRELGWPWLPTAALDALLPPALSLHRLQAVAVDKGCYPGQEIVARLHWRGEHKRHLCQVTLDQPAAAGTALRHANRAIGVLLGHDHDASRNALAVLADDAVAQLDEASSLRLDNGSMLHLHQRWPD